MKQKDAQDIRPADAREEDQHLANEELIRAPRQAKLPVLHDLILRPPISGKKTVGSLECHTNGFRFMSSKGQKVDFTFNNIRNAFFQPCEETDIIVLIHFRLKAPILIGTKKFLDIQFYSEVCNQFEDIDARKKTRMTEQDEVIQEKREREIRKRLDDKFQRFCQNSESFAAQYKHDIIFDIPFS